MDIRLCLGLALVVGCGPTASSEAGDAGTGTGGAETTVGGGTSGGEACEELLPAPSAPVMLRVRNDRPEAIFIDSFGCGPGVRITSGGQSTQWQFPGCNLAPCEGVLSGDCGITCADCAQGILRIASGGTYEQLWEGGVYVDTQAPQECVAEGCQPECHQALPIPAASYELGADVFLSCPLDTPDLCECPGGEQDACAIFSESPTAGGTTRVSVAFDYPAETTAEIVVAP